MWTVFRTFVAVRRRELTLAPVDQVLVWRLRVPRTNETELESPSGENLSQRHEKLQRDVCVISVIEPLAWPQNSPC